ncbi:MAG: benzoyl-CoA reductase subunit C [Planctomycetota bacterium]|nr:MAG: benzoyl-CoA reductase subunit C [Planctomycetota bacterium]
MSRLESLFSAARAAVEDTEFRALRAWKEEQPGRHCVGFFPVYAPQELLWAAGALPVALWGGGDQVEVERADARLQSFICSISRSTLELGMTGRLDFLDGILFSSLCDVARNLSGVWQRNFPGMLCEYLHYPQNPASGGARDYYRGELERLAGRLAAVTGTEVTAERLEHAIGLYERQRALLRSLAAVRTAEPWRLSLEEHAALLRSCGRRDPRAQNAVLEELLALLPARECRRRDGVRVVLEGSFCEQPPMDLLRVLDEAHCFVVDSDLGRGMNWFRRPLARGDDPWDDLVAAYFESAEPSVVRHHDSAERSARLVERARAHRADGVVFCTAKFCEPALYDFVLHKAALEREGIPFLSVEFEEKMASFESIRTQAETFSESILFFAEEKEAVS